jgi:hypothetical protein
MRGNLIAAGYFRRPSLRDFAIRHPQVNTPLRLGIPALFPGFKNEIEWRGGRATEAREARLHKNLA